VLAAKCRQCSFNKPLIAAALFIEGANEFLDESLLFRNRGQSNVDILSTAGLDDNEQSTG